ncbi:hypothetical protein EJD96_22025 [Herbaspirillum seropedicae]|uniref:hypothetical protein n=1 Tax=Herbaspirillum seropedicae TaxID=964 RepID=UPI00111D2BE3|nr:hypothetical protein [Herbaspirillum seropedicae]QDD66650.1 hypothetical protein EJD96_22025 [Herbaspirillum seropedicae]
MDKETGDLIQWLAAPVATITAVWLTNRHNRRKDKAAQEYVFRKETYGRVLKEIVAIHQLFAEMIRGVPPEETRFKRARAVGQAISAVQLIAKPETVRLVQSYGLELNKVMFDVTMRGYEVEAMRAEVERLPPGREKEVKTTQLNMAMVTHFEMLAPVLERLINESVPALLAIRSELEIDTDAELFGQVTKQTAAEGKALLKHMGLELRRRAALS